MVFDTGFCSRLHCRQPAAGLRDVAHRLIALLDGNVLGMSTPTLALLAGIGAIRGCVSKIAVPHI
jgi:hypothetical protein